MQGQRSSVRTLGKNFLSDSSSTSNEAAVDCQMSLDILQATAQSQLSDYRMPADIPCLQHSGAEWCFGESSSAAAHDRKLEHPWRTTGPERRYEEQEHHSGVSGLPPATVDVPGLSSSSSQRGNGSFLLFAPSPSSEGLAQDLNVSAGFDDVEEDGFEASRTVGTSSEHPRRSADSLDLDADFRGVDALRMPYKRKAIEARTSQSSGTGGTGSSERTGRSQWHAQQSLQIAASTENELVTEESTNSRIRIGVGSAFSATSSLLAAAGRPDSSSRNSRHGSYGLNQQDAASGNNFMAEVDVASVEASSSQHSSRLSLHNYLLDLNPSPGLGNGSHNGHSVLQPHPLRGISQPRWSSAASRRTSSISTTSGARNAPRNVPISLSQHPMFLPVDEIGSLSEHPVNWNSASGSLRLGGHVGSTSRAGSSRTTTTTPSSSSGWPLRSGPRYNNQRISDMMRRTLLSSAGSGSGLLSSNHALQGGSSASQELDVPPAPDNHRQRASNSRSSQSEMNLDGAFGVPYSLRNLASAGEGRRSLMTEIRHVLDLMRRGESLRFEDMMFLDHSVLVGMTDIHDRHRDLRMDVDNMSYEELLALEERIGSVCTGLTEEAIAKHLKKRKYVQEAEQCAVDVEEKEPCCICREEYLAGEDVGELNCGHDFHTHCIKQWLLQKNICPICKTAGLDT